MGVVALRVGDGARGAGGRRRGGVSAGELGGVGVATAEDGLLQDHAGPGHGNFDQRPEAEDQSCHQRQRPNRQYFLHHLCILLFRVGATTGRGTTAQPGRPWAFASSLARTSRHHVARKRRSHRRQAPRLESPTTKDPQDLHLSCEKISSQIR